MTMRDRVVQAAPAMLRRTWGARFLHGLAMMFDGASEWGLQGLRARLPTKATPTALAAIGRDRLIAKGYQETDAAYALRLKRWLDDWKIAGNPVAILQQLQAFFAPQKPRIRTVSNKGTWFTIETDGTIVIHRLQGNWNWDGNTAATYWWRFWVIVYPNSVSPPIFDDEDNWGDAGNWGDASESWGLGIPSAHMDSMRALIGTWKPEGTYCVGLIAAFDNASFDPTAASGSAGMPDGTWGAYSKIVGGVAVPSRLETARYSEGVI